MDIESFTHRSQEALRRAVAIARERRHPQAGPAHLLTALLEQTEGVVLSLLDRLEVTPTTLRNRTAEVLEASPAAHGASGEVQLGVSLQRVLESAQQEAEQLGLTFSRLDASWA
ncbi:MAG: Clp protease N-terminal domain-containing protein, partial [Nitriliruptoraceae bacterium]